MELGHLELLSLEPVTAEIAIDLEFGALVFQMFLNSLERLDLLGATEALYFESLALVLDMLLEVLQVDALLDLRLVAAVEHFDLTKHLIEQLVLNFLEDREVDELTRLAFVIFGRLLNLE